MEEERALNRKLGLCEEGVNDKSFFFYQAKHFSLIYIHFTLAAFINFPKEL